MRKAPLTLTRRKMLQWSTAAAVGVCARRGMPAWTDASTRRPAAFRPTLLSEFDYGQVELASCPAQRQFEQNHELLLNMNEDSLLRPFRVRERMPAPGESMGGWYSTDGFAPACTFGQWISALARMYPVTRDDATRAKIDRLIRGYAATIDPEGKFYRHNRFPGYFYDKMVCGLNEAHLHVGNPVALEVLARATDAVLPYLPPHAMPRQETPVLHGEDFTRHVWDETYTMPENLFLTWRRTGAQRYFDLAQRFIFDQFFDPLSRGENVLPGRHAYSHMNSLSSAATSYLALGKEKYLLAAKNAFDIVQKQSYATGGWGPREHFIEPGSGALGDSLTNIRASFETPCGAYAHFKIARYLLRITADPRYGDSMEQVFYNTVLGAKPIQPDGRSFYYSDYTYDALKVFHPDKWPCCSGTLPQIAADYRISAYFRHPRGVYVNLYLPSILRWQTYGVEFSLRQTTEYPYTGHIRLDLTASSPAETSVFLRIPAWARGASLTASGIRGSRMVTPGSFAEVRRTWKTGDAIELELPFTNRLTAVDAQHPDVMALTTGPLVLMALRDARQNEPSQTATRETLLAARQSTSGAHQWRAGAMRLKPFLDIGDGRYSSYVKISHV
jgi:uncharacterized protein